MRSLRYCLSLLPLLLASAAFAHGGTVLPAASRPLSGAGLLAPVTPACVSSPFGPRVLPNRPLAGTFHNGIDLPAPEGAPVRAVGPGEVIRAQRHGPGGLELLIQHDGFVAVYSHLGSVAPSIAEGRRTVYGGEKIGVVGHTGVTYGMHLFLAMIRDGRFVDPTPYFGFAQCGVAHRTRADMLAADGKVPPTRLYGVPTRHYAAR
jgi:murein DD-endopeptidase MepM/ murein hydrolase activator NlpD